LLIGASCFESPTINTRRLANMERVYWFSLNWKNALIELVTEG
jgi:hypothetical protein